jgi:hypothetical protein
MTQQRVDHQTIEALLRALSRELPSSAPLRVLLVGGTILVHAGWRQTTKDVDLTIEADDSRLVAEAEEAVNRVQDSQHIPIDFVSPGLFLPLPRGWRDRCQYLKRVGQLEVFYFDFVSTALAKIARANPTDRTDVQVLVQRGHLTLEQLDQAVEDLFIVLEATPGRYFTDPVRFRTNYIQVVRPLLLAGPDQAAPP